jgi:hypothetical protein
MMLRMSSIDERIVAALHDVCEDCPGWTFDRLRREGFSRRIIDALQSVTKRDGEGYEDFVRRAATNPIGHLLLRLVGILAFLFLILAQGFLTF